MGKKPPQYFNCFLMKIIKTKVVNVPNSPRI